MGFVFCCLSLQVTKRRIRDLEEFWGDVANKVAVIGCGFYAQNHLHAWKDLAKRGAALVAVCDADSEKAKHAAISLTLLGTQMHVQCCPLKRYIWLIL